MSRRLGSHLLEQRLGGGTYGEVWRSGQLAIKVLHPQRATSQVVSRFRQEAEALARLPEHPHLVKIRVPLAYDDAEQAHYFGMEYLEGGSLSSAARNPEPVLLCQSLAGALHHLHEHGLCHRDLAPGNVLFDSKGQVKLGDLGMLSRIGEAGPTPACWFAHGDPHYTAPERIFHIESGPQGDAYSLGALIYEVVTGHNPFPLSRLASLQQAYPRQIEQFQALCIARGEPLIEVNFRSVYEHYLKHPIDWDFQKLPAPLSFWLPDLLQADYWLRLSRFHSLKRIAHA